MTYLDIDLRFSVVTYIVGSIYVMLPGPCHVCSQSVAHDMCSTFNLCHVNLTNVIGAPCLWNVMSVVTYVVGSIYVMLPGPCHVCSQSVAQDMCFTFDLCHVN